jgi:hypothetical protein
MPFPEIPCGELGTWLLGLTSAVKRVDELTALRRYAIATAPPLSAAYNATE